MTYLISNLSHFRIKTVWFALLPLAAFLSIGCTTPLHRQVAKITPTMDKLDVLEVAGSPARTSYENDKHIWIYLYPVDHNMEATQITFENNFVTNIQPYVLRPEKTQVAMDSSSFLEYEKAILKKRENRQNKFIDLEE